MNFSGGSVSRDTFTGAPGSDGDANGAGVGTGASVAGGEVAGAGRAGMGMGMGLGMGMGMGMGMGGAGVNSAGAGAEPLDGLTQEQIQVMKMTKFMERAMESCPVRTALAGGAGFALGGIFGLFIASMSYDTPMHLPGSTAPAISSLPLRQQLKIGLRDMGSRSYSTAKNFALVGTIYAGTECAIESLRARHDMYNSVSSGCITGGILAKSAGPKAAAVGCAGFAAFSAAIDYYMNRMD